MLKLLFKIQMASAYRSILFLGNNKSKKISPVKIILISLLALYVIGALFLSVGFMFYELGSGLIPLGLGWVYFANIGLMAFGMSVIFTVFMTQSMLFEAKDNQLLLPLPIKPSRILGSRLLVLAVFDYITSLLFLLPAGAIYVYIAKPSVLFYVIFLLTTILLPLLGLTVASIFGYIISSVTKRMRNKSLFTTLFSLVLLGLYVWGYGSLTSGITALVNNGASIGEAIKRMFPPFYHFGAALDSMDIVSLIYFVLWCLIPFAIMYFLLSKFFIALAASNRQAKRQTYKEGKLGSSSIYKALLKKEFYKFLNTPMYLLNAGLGFLMNIAFGVFFFIKGPDIMNSLFSNVQGVSGYTLPAVTAVLCFIASMSITTAPSVSLEGRNLWILKSNPINVKDIFNAKLSLNLILGFSTLLFAGICVAYRIEAQFIEALLVMLIPISVQAFTAQEGLICNLFFPKLDAVNDTVVVKQSASVIVSMLISMALMVFIIAAYILLLPYEISFGVFGLGVFLIINILNIAANRFIMTKGIKIFNAL